VTGPADPEVVHDRLTRLERENRLLRESLDQATRVSKLREQSFVTLKSATEKLRASEDRFLDIANSSDEGVVVVNSDARITFWNPAAARIFGFSKDEAMGALFHDLVVPLADREKAHHAFRRFVDEGESRYLGSTVDREFVREDGEKVYVEIRLTVFELMWQQQIIASVRDVTEQRRTHSELEFLAVHDALTGVYNRRGLETRLDEDLRRASRYNRPLSLLVVDVDEFKRVNDRHGHECGDKVLKQLTDIVALGIRNVDYLGRLGGDEFVVVLVETPNEDAMTTARRICDEVASTATTLADDAQVRATVSIGVASYPGSGASREAILARADKTMYEAKSRGGNQVIAC
jgi:diguanylate cyclase (GGDEF)-like protein/PAS domain S-box-containing protein